jgi:hypothetical protein
MYTYSKDDKIKTMFKVVTALMLTANSDAVHRV